jgi:hypothetical protein
MSDEDLKAELERLLPVTLYKEQWLRLLNVSDEIRAFIAENDARLKGERVKRNCCQPIT